MDSTIIEVSHFFGDFPLIHGGSVVPGPDPKILKPKVVALQRDTAALLKLLGGDGEDRLRFWEIIKGITTPVQLEMASHQLDVMQNMLKQVAASTKALEKASKPAARAAKGGA
ncbi:hypothetical protein [Paludibaculum fermentans]|uniref:Uncharacterized protein n=1 Tax=Paludibaculum fermentans TaxID=1473598 RepID=A0A7S7SMR6_PALFE|nr:hypothetical protein [Paludibaculum fermentans]QOY89320.1 hypothetical protein IRI77_05015 [Paludibaculum fermentans]